MTIQQAKQFRQLLEIITKTFSDEEALQVPTYVNKWFSAKQYSVGDRVNYNDVLYKCLQAHTAQESWTPTAAPSLWAKVLTSESGEALEWEQPDSTNPYMKGDKVTYQGKTYESTCDNNVWSPGVYGWSELN